MELKEIGRNLFSVRDRSYGGLEGNGGMIRRPDGGVSAVTAVHVVVDEEDGSMIPHDLEMHPGRNGTSRVSFRRCRGYDTASLDLPNETEGVPLATELNTEEELYMVGDFHPQTGLPFSMQVKLWYINNNRVSQNENVILQGGERIYLSVANEGDAFQAGMSGSLIVNARGEAVGLMQEDPWVLRGTDELSTMSHQALGTVLSLKSLEPIE